MPGDIRVVCSHLIIKGGDGKFPRGIESPRTSIPNGSVKGNTLKISSNLIQIRKLSHWKGPLVVPNNSLHSATLRNA